MKNKLIAGIIFCVAGIIYIFFTKSESSVPIGIAIEVIGIALIAKSKK